MAHLTHLTIHSTTSIHSGFHGIEPGIHSGINGIDSGIHTINPHGIEQATQNIVVRDSTIPVIPPPLGGGNPIPPIPIGPPPYVPPGTIIIPPPITPTPIIIIPPPL